MKSAKAKYQEEFAILMKKMATDPTDTTIKNKLFELITQSQKDGVGIQFGNDYDDEVMDLVNDAMPNFSMIVDYCEEIQAVLDRVPYLQSIMGADIQRITEIMPEYSKLFSSEFDVDEDDD